MNQRIVVLVASLCTLIATSAHALSFSPLWNDSWGDASQQQIYDVAIEGATGRVAITGTFTGGVDFGGGLMTSAGGNDGFIVTFEPDGTFIAQRQFGDASAQFGTAVGWGAAGYLYVVGYFAGTVNMGGTNLTSAGTNDIVIARYDYRLAHSVSKKFGDASTQLAVDLTVDDGDNVIVTGYYQGTVNFGGSLLTSAGSYDMYLVKFNSSLTHTWSKSFGDAAGSQFGSGVGTDGTESVYLCGYYTGTVNFGTPTSLLTSLGSNDICIAKFNSAGTPVWSKTFGDANNQVAYRIAVNGGGEAYITGFFTGTVNFGGTLLTSIGAEDIFLAKFTALGSHLWSKRFGDASTQIGMSVVADNNAVYLGAQTVGNVDFGGGNQIGAGGRDAAFAKFNSDGSPVWGRLFGDGSDQYGYSVDLGAGHVALAGYFQGSMDFGLGALTAGGIDAFVVLASTDPREPVMKSVRDVPNDQGRKVRVSFHRSGNDDALSPDPIVRYEAYVEDTSNPIVSAMRSPAGGGPLVYVGSVPAHAEPGYEMIVPTFTDSTISYGDFNTRVFIYAARQGTIGFFFGGPGVGSSIDNLAPGMSALRLDDHFLQWNASTAPDVNYYSVYGASTANFGSSTLVDYTIDTAIDLTASPRAYYFVTATDFSGNEGAPVIVRVLTGIDGTPSSRVLSISAYPNPFNPATTIRYTVPARGHVHVEVFDARGAHVSTLFNGEREAGAYSVKWDGRNDDAGGAASGVYFARITQNGASRTYKLVLLK